MRYDCELLKLEITNSSVNDKYNKEARFRTSQRRFIFLPKVETWPKTKKATIYYNERKIAHFSKYNEILWFDNFLIMITNLNDEKNGTPYTKTVEL